MRIIIDGCDKSGKSTLIEALKNKLPNLLSIKLLTKPTDDSDESKEYIKAMYSKMGQLTLPRDINFVFDRFYPSELAYSFKRGYEADEDPFFAILEAELQKAPNLYIMLEAPADVVAARFKSDGETFAKVEEIEKIQARYRAHYDRCILNKIAVDTTDRLDIAVAEILDAVKKCEKVQVLTTDFSD